MTFSIFEFFQIKKIWCGTARIICNQKNKWEKKVKNHLLFFHFIHDDFVFIHFRNTLMYFYFLDEIIFFVDILFPFKKWFSFYFINWLFGDYFRIFMIHFPTIKKKELFFYFSDRKHQKNDNRKSVFFFLICLKKFFLHLFVLFLWRKNSTRILRKTQNIFFDL